MSVLDVDQTAGDALAQDLLHSLRHGSSGLPAPTTKMRSKVSGGAGNDGARLPPDRRL